MNKIHNFDKFNHIEFITESYELVKDHMTVDEFNELVGEGFFSFIKGLFTNPIQKRKLDKLGQDLLKTKIELMKLEIEEDSINSFRTQLSAAKDRGFGYEISSSKVDVADKAKAAKIKSLEDRESNIVDQMDLIGGESEKLQKYVDKLKFEVRIKANDATIHIADGEIERILKDLKNADTKAISVLDRELNKS